MSAPDKFPPWLTRPARWLVGWSVLIAVVILGPALGRGVVLSYDLVWSPDSRLTPFATGIGTPAPRAVPSDAAAWLLGLVVTPAVAQKLILGSILVGASLGGVALLRHLRPGAGRMAVAAAALAMVWNPFVSERLVIGQWTVVLGYAVLPWGLRAAVRLVQGEGSVYAVVLAMCLAAVGGANSVLLVALGVFPVLLAGRLRPARGSVWSTVLVAVSTLGVSAAWLLPALTGRVAVDSRGVDAFAPEADTPLGVWGSLLSGGGFWNTASHPVQRSVLLIALVAAIISVVGIAYFAKEAIEARHRLLFAPLLVGVLLVALSAMPAARGLWTWLVTEVPGGGALRDSQKFLAVWVVTMAVGIGIGIDRMRGSAMPGAGPASVTVIGLVLLVSPQLAWGVGGALVARPVPDGYRAAAAYVSSLPHGDVGLLPWSQYRRYDWNQDRVSLTLGPRVFDQRVLFNDSLPLRSGVVTGEDPRAAAVSREIAQGATPVDALRHRGVRYLAAELGAGMNVDEAAVRGAGRVIVDDPRLLVVEVEGGTTTPATSPWNLVGWLVTGSSAVIIFTYGAVRVSRRKLPTGLLRFRA